MPEKNTKHLSTRPIFPYRPIPKKFRVPSYISVLSYGYVLIWYAVLTAISTQILMKSWLCLRITKSVLARCYCQANN